ncbi:MAG: hypothetical protein JRJ47_10425 [Deltaproteobacteria bacterium]|nr:hypothetical protein [Deltaproteobacteria bacterium]
MEKASGKFGGWLRVLQVVFSFIVFYSLANLALTCLWNLGLFPSFHPEWNVLQRRVYTGHTTMSSTLDIYLYYLLLRTIKIKSADSPNRIVRIALCLAVLWVIMYSIGIPVQKCLVGTSFTYPSWKESVSFAFKPIAFYCAWATYFFKSKRVLAYYGANADLYH